ncbi:MAG: hypothetical protein MJ220_03815 [Bacilli bacterium]|nr:hypothetical protein [Bacilli bacterium]
MILIIGSTFDDVLYFDAKVRNKREEKPFGSVNVFSGDIFSQRVIVAYGASTSYIASAATAYLAAKYSTILVINVGSCFSYNDQMRPGDIAISESIHICDVDQRAVDSRLRIGQIPGMPQYFNVMTYLANLTITTAEKLSLTNVKSATIFSTDTIYKDVEETRHFTSGEYVLGSNKNIVFDSESGGVTVASSLIECPSLSVKVVTSPFKDKVETKDLVNVMKAYARVGKLLIALIGEISRNDTIMSN